MTFSIIARDRKTGALGVATATGGPAVGSLVPHAMAGHGALATQGYTNPFYAHDGLALLAQGLDADQIVRELTQADPGRDKRQLIVIDKTGRSAGWTGPELSPAAGMKTQDGLAIAGNLLENHGVIEAMWHAFEMTHADPLADRMLAALQAGQRAGGDRRGTRSAALKTYGDQLYPLIDIRIDYSGDPIGELEKLLGFVRQPDYADFVADLPRR